MIFLCVPLCIVFSMLGGQINKLFRSIGITLSILTISLTFHNHPWWCVLPVLLYGVIETLGYGPNSKLMKWLKDEELVRDFYGATCAVPVLITSFLTYNYLAISGCTVVILVYQLREGSWGKIGKYDILPDDLFRGLAVGLAMSWALL